MILAYYSRTGNVRDFLEWYMPEFERRNIEEWNADEAFILVTPTYDFGQVPDAVREWLNEDTEEYYDEFPGVPKPNNSFMEGVIGSGNRNWGGNYALAADTISEKYGVPLIGKFELKGNDNNAEYIKRRMSEIYGEQV